MKETLLCRNLQWILWISYWVLQQLFKHQVGSWAPSLPQLFSQLIRQVPIPILWIRIAHHCQCQVCFHVLHHICIQVWVTPFIALMAGHSTVLRASFSTVLVTGFSTVHTTGFNTVYTTSFSMAHRIPRIKFTTVRGDGLRKISCRMYDRAVRRVVVARRLVEINQAYQLGKQVY